MNARFSDILKFLVSETKLYPAQAVRAITHRRALRVSICLPRSMASELERASPFSSLLPIRRWRWALFILVRSALLSTFCALPPDAPVACSMQRLLQCCARSGVCLRACESA